MSGFGKKITPETDKPIVKNQPEVKAPVYSKMDAKLFTISAGINIDEKTFKKSPKK